MPGRTDWRVETIRPSSTANIMAVDRPTTLVGGEIARVRERESPSRPRDVMPAGPVAASSRPRRQPGTVHEMVEGGPIGRRFEQVPPFGRGSGAGRQQTRPARANSPRGLAPQSAAGKIGVSERRCVMARARRSPRRHLFIHGRAPCARR
jgi:hypothetical protein